MQERRLHSEEKASSLRDDKLLAVADDPLSPHHTVPEDNMRGDQAHGPSHKLTRENLDRHTSDNTLPPEAMLSKPGKGSAQKRSLG
jgi:hypothetical protein